MRYYLFLFSGLLVLAACSGPAPKNPLATHLARPGTALFPIVVQGRWGFIDSTGAVIIAPHFAQVQPFSEGLAPAREGEFYGYIDYTGRFVLPPRYTYANSFQGNFALVSLDSTQQLIDRAGHLVPLPATYQRLEWYAKGGQSGYWVGILPNRESQLLTAQGSGLKVSEFSSIGELSSNRMVVGVAEPTADPDAPDRTEQTGVLNSRGRLVIPYHRFSQISTFRDGVATATLYQRVPDEKSQQTCIIDTTGRVLRYLPTATYSTHEDEFTDGILQANLITRVIDELNNESYPVALDRSGKALFHRPDLKLLSKYSHSCAWATGPGDGWFLLSKAGQQLNKVAVQSVLWSSGADTAPSFADGVELVALAREQGYATLDTAGRVVSRLAGARPGPRDPERLGDIMAFYTADSTLRAGFWNWRTGLLLKPRFSSISQAGYQHGLLAVVEDHRLGYLSPAGRYVWREAAKTSAPLNLDYMRRSYYYAASPSLRRYAGAGGWGASGTMPHVAPLLLMATSAISVSVAPQATADAFAPGAEGHRVAITNSTADTVVFDAQDSRLYMAVQALNAQGQWHDIEYIPSSFCGNSYHQVFLAPGQYWQLTVPAYTGQQPTLLRVRVRHRHTPTSRRESVTVYSNSFVGSVNPAQFWRKPGYSPQDIMDPYNN
ncbi:MAG: WG repeat-containing protein [Janthinobacterium lividum]